MLKLAAAFFSLLLTTANAFAFVELEMSHCLNKYNKTYSDDVANHYCSCVEKTPTSTACVEILVNAKRNELKNNLNKSAQRINATSSPSEPLNKKVAAPSPAAPPPARPEPAQPAPSQPKDQPKKPVKTEFNIQYY